ncbi:MAG: LPS export ABC transporter periplasmic protein LptC [Candidatus Acidiferrales bacterium]
MRNAEAARYARWAGGVAIVIVATVVAVFVARSMRESNAERHAPKPVPSTVEQASAEFSFSKVEQDHTIYTVTASHATQFKDRDLSVLEDVTITLFGPDGSRNDTIHTGKCNYETGSGRIRCQGAARIDVQSAATPGDAVRIPPGGGAKPRELQIDTTDITFDRDAGHASTAQPVQFQFPNGQGHAVGVDYDSKTGLVQLDRDIEMQMHGSGGASGMPVNLTGSRLVYDRNSHAARLDGPAKAKQGDRELSAGKMSLELDKDMHARHGVAQGNAQFKTLGVPESVTVSAERFDADMNVAGWVENVAAAGNVRGERKGAFGTDRLTAQNMEVPMDEHSKQPRDLKARGDVKLETHGSGGSQELETSALAMTFAPGLRPSQRRIDTATTLAPATIDLVGPDGSTNLHATRARAEFDAQNKMREFYGDSGVQVLRRSGSSAPQRTTAQQMAASLDDAGQWDTIQLDGKVHFTQADRTADAHHAQIAKATDTISLEGSPVVSDSSSRTTATKIQIHQESGDVSATGAVRTTYVSSGQSTVPNLGPGPAHISADSLAGSSKTGRLTYTGHARLWQGDAVLDANTIELFRDEDRIDAAGNVVAVFPQASNSNAPDTVPTLWKVRAPMMRYWDNLGRAHVEGGVNAESTDQALQSSTLELFLSPATPPPTGKTPLPAAKPGASANAPPATGGRQLTHAVALGHVIVRQGDRHGTSERADYTAADEKFVLSGGQPTLTDASNDTTTGRSLTFFRASDTILIDSEAGSRTLTKHRVEK